MNNIIKNSNIVAEVDTYGAYLNSLKFNDVEILFSRTKINENDVLKDRGGSHICLPLFGIHEKYDLPRHGFGRISEWEIIQKNDTEITYELVNSKAGYGDLISRLSYLIHGNTFISKLRLKNTGSEELEVSPGFHPYFKIDKISNTLINDEDIAFTNKEFIDSVFTDEINKIETPKYIVNISNKDLSKFVLWTSFSGDFLCVEPTYNYLDNGYMLKSGEVKEFVFEIEVELKQI